MAVALSTPNIAEARAELQRRAALAASRDTLAFIECYRPQIRQPAQGYEVFRPFPYQRELIRTLDTGQRAIVLKSRQTGITTAVMVQKLRRCLQSATTVLIVSINRDKAKHNVEIARQAYERCVTPFPVKITTDNITELGFANGSIIKAEPSTPRTGRTFAASDAVLDEAAFLLWQEEMWKALAPTVSLGGQLTVLSTPDMEGDLFHQQWETAQAPGSGWVPLRVHWSERPDFDQAWYERERPNYTAAEWASEFECEFGHAAEAVFRGDFIKRAGELGELPWERTEQSRFIIGGDLAGEGHHCSVLCALDVAARPARVAAVRSWETLPAPALQGEIEKMATEYACAPWLDRTGLGWSVIQNLTISAVGVGITGGQAITGDETSPNVPRTRLINNLVLGLEQEQIAIPAEFQQMLLGLRSYRWDKRKGTYADFVDALAIAWWAANQRARSFAEFL